MLGENISINTITSVFDFEDKCFYQMDIKINVYFDSLMLLILWCVKVLCANWVTDV